VLYFRTQVPQLCANSTYLEILAGALSIQHYYKAGRYESSFSELGWWEHLTVHPRTGSRYRPKVDTG
jgi:hypothetical protein